MDERLADEQKEEERKPRVFAGEFVEGVHDVLLETLDGVWFFQNRNIFLCGTNRREPTRV